MAARLVTWESAEMGAGILPFSGLSSDVSHKVPCVGAILGRDGKVKIIICLVPQPAKRLNKRLGRWPAGNSGPHIDEVDVGGEDAMIPAAARE
jgi:hypothetical protein